MRNLFFVFLCIFSFTITVQHALASGVTQYNDEQFSFVSSYLKDFDQDYSILSVKNKNYEHAVQYAIIFPHTNEVQRGKEFKLISLFECPEDFKTIPNDVACFGKVEMVDGKGTIIKYAPMKLLGRVEITDEDYPVAKINVHSENVKGILSEANDPLVKTQVSSDDISISSVVNLNLGSNILSKPFYRLTLNH